MSSTSNSRDYDPIPQEKIHLPGQLHDYPALCMDERHIVDLINENRERIVRADKIGNGYEELKNSGFVSISLVCIAENGDIALFEHSANGVKRLWTFVHSADIPQKSA